MSHENPQNPANGCLCINCSVAVGIPEKGPIRPLRWTAHGGLSSRRSIKQGGKKSYRKDSVHEKMKNLQEREKNSDRNFQAGMQNAKIVKQRFLSLLSSSSPSHPSSPSAVYSPVNPSSRRHSGQWEPNSAVRFWGSDSAVNVLSPGSISGSYSDSQRSPCSPSSFAHWSTPDNVSHLPLPPFGINRFRDYASDGNEFDQGSYYTSGMPSPQETSNSEQLMFALELSDSDMTSEIPVPNDAHNRELSSSSGTFAEAIGRSAMVSAWPWGDYPEYSPNILSNSQLLENENALSSASAELARYAGPPPSISVTCSCGQSAPTHCSAPYVCVFCTASYDIPWLVSDAGSESFELTNELPEPVRFLSAFAHPRNL